MTEKTSPLTSFFWAINDFFFLTGASVSIAPSLKCNDRNAKLPNVLLVDHVAVQRQQYVELLFRFGQQCTVLKSCPAYQRARFYIVAGEIAT
jgi:hypothetical protein